MRQLTFLMTLLCCVGFTASAEEFTFTFTGVLGDVPTELAGEFASGMPFSGEYTFESTTADLLPGDVSRGSYVGAISDFQLMIGANSYGESFAGDISYEDSVSNTTWNQSSGDYYGATAIVAGPNVGAFSPLLSAIQLYEPTIAATALTNDLLSGTPPQLGDFSTAVMTLDFGDGQELVRLSGELTTLQVPEPSSIAICVLAALTVLYARKRRSSDPGLRS